MAKDIHDIRFVKCDWSEIHPFVEAYLQSHKITVDSFWEDHVLESNHYKMTQKDEIVGYFSIQGEETLMLFYVSPSHARLSQELFAQVKKYEKVTNAMVATGDEFLMSHCFDNYARIEKQAYLSVYTDKEIPETQLRPVSLRLADITNEDDMATLALSGNFLNGEIAGIRKGVDEIKIYIAEMEGETIGFGVLQYGIVLRDIASIGMYVCATHRQQGLGSSILQSLKAIAKDNGCRAVSGCWYYNHNSKKSMEKAGAYSKTRLIRFYF